MRRAHDLAAALALIALAACGDAPVEAPTDFTPKDPAPTFDYPLDDTLRLHELQAKSTHNSYHLESEGSTVSAWHYTHAPLDVQLEAQGVRHVELDLRLDLALQTFAVYHLPVIDERTSCRVFTDCLRAMKGWSDAHPAHHPIVVQLELKDLPGDPEAYFALLHAEILSVWPAPRVLTPDEVQGDQPTLADAVRSEGWPTLGALRGRVLFTLDDAGELQRAYTRDRTGLDGRLIFAHSTPLDPFAAVAVLNDPVIDAAAIAGALAAHMLVRTRADSDGVEPFAGDTARRDAALAGGAQFVSTDFPGPTDGLDYWLDIPGGTPSRCNPITAPAACTSEAIEDPAFMP